jgi:hypothetical protein
MQRYQNLSQLTESGKKEISVLHYRKMCFGMNFSSTRLLASEKSGRRGEKLFRIVTKETHQYGCFRACLMLNDWYTSYERHRSQKEEITTKIY